MDTSLVQSIYCAHVCVCVCAGEQPGQGGVRPGPGDEADGPADGEPATLGTDPASLPPPSPAPSPPSLPPPTPPGTRWLPPITFPQRIPVGGLALLLLFAPFLSSHIQPDLPAAQTAGPPAGWNGFRSSSDPPCAPYLLLPFRLPPKPSSQ